MSRGDWLDVTEVKQLSTGYVRVSAGSQAWAQLPKVVWDALPAGDVVPAEYTFEPDWNRVVKPRHGPKP